MVESLLIKIKEIIMPTYEYQCSKCGFKFEVFRSITTKYRGKCPRCHSRARRLVGIGGGIIFKGPGFYTTEYRDKNQNDNQKKAI